MSKNTTPKQSNKTAWISGIVAAAIAIGGSVGYVMYKQNQNIKQIAATQDKQFKALVAALVEADNNRASLSPEDLSEAVEMALQQRVIAQQQQIRQERIQKYQLASNSIPDDKHIYGDYNARFTLVEFSDIECPYCKRFHDTPKQIVDQSQGNVNWQWKHFPLSFHNPTAERQAQATECVADLQGNQMFWVYLDELFKQTAGGGRGADVMRIAQELGIDQQAFTQCLESGKFQEKVRSDIAQATKMGITGTPATFIVDNHTGKTQFLSGAQPKESILAAIRKMAVESEEKADG